MSALAQKATGNFVDQVHASRGTIRFEEVVREVRDQCPNNTLGNEMRAALNGGFLVGPVTTTPWPQF
jgi:hypothetical protein